VQSHESLEGCEDGPVASKMIRTTRKRTQTTQPPVGTSEGSEHGQSRPLGRSVMNSDSLRFGLQRHRHGTASASACKLQEFLALVSRTNLRPLKTEAVSETSPVRWEPRSIPIVHTGSCLSAF
jgi:hypothetical protein